jgi:hypothetical protein
LSLALLLLTAFVALPKNSTSAIWGPEIDISNDIPTENQTNPSVAAAGGKVHVVWLNHEDGDTDVYYRQFDGVDWTPEQEISVDAGSELQMSPKVAVEGEVVHVVWEDYGDGDPDIFYRCFNGTDWLPMQEITNDGGAENQSFPSIAADDGKVYVVWQDEGDGDPDIYHRYFDGVDWQPEEEISSDAGTEAQLLPSVAAGNGSVHVVWMDAEGGNLAIHYRFHNGTDWHAEEDIGIDNGQGANMFPTIAVEGGDLHLAWVYSPETIDYGIYYRHYDGTSWQPAERISEDTPGEVDVHWCPSIAVESDIVYVVWDHAVGMVGDSDSDIRIRYSYQGKWQAEREVSIDDGQENQMFPSLALDGGKAHIVWSNVIPGINIDIYYRTAEFFIPPESSISLIPHYWQRTLPFEVLWSASDDLDLESVSLYYRYGTDNSSWSNWMLWSLNDTISGTSASGSFLFDAPDGDGFYEFYSIAEDVHENQELPSESPDTAVCVDTTAPTVLEVTPPDQSTDIVVNVTISVVFSERMDETVTSNAFRLTRDGVKVNGTISWSADGQSLTFSPSHELGEGRTYEVVVNVSAKDVAGNELIAGNVTSFETFASERERGFLDMYWWILVLVVIVPVVLVLIAWSMRRRPRPDWETVGEDSTE